MKAELLILEMTLFHGVLSLLQYDFLKVKENIFLLKAEWESLDTVLFENLDTAITIMIMIMRLWLWK